MGLKGIHGHIRHTHEDKIAGKKKGRKQKEPTAVQKEVELYSGNFQPATPTKPAHYVAVCTEYLHHHTTSPTSYSLLDATLRTFSSLQQHLTS